MQKIKLIKFVSLESIIVFSIIFLIFINLGLAISDSKNKYINHSFRKELISLEKHYVDSQYVSKNPKYIIPDEFINAYAGWEYIKGINPVLIAADTPPFGRYIIGVSAFFFDNENFPSITASIISLFIMYLLGMQIFKSRILALIPPLLFSFEPIFKNQIIYSPLLDIIQLMFLLLIFYFFNRGFENKKFLISFLLANIFLGLFISTKFFATGSTIIAASLIVLVLNKEFKKLKSYLITLPASIIVLLLSYVRVLAFNYSINDFLGIQKYVFLYHKSQLILPFTIWPLLLFNKWFVWYGDKPVISDPQWQISWPVITLLTFISVLLYVFKKINRQKNLEILIAWSIIYVLFFSLGQVTARYLVILIPIMYIISTYAVKELVLKYSK